MAGGRTWLRAVARIAVWAIVGALPMAGLASLLLRSQLDPHIENYPLHFVVFGVVGAVAFALGYTAGEAANRRGDARVLLLSLAFMTTGGFLCLARDRDAERPFPAGALRLPGRDPRRTRPERLFRGGISVRTSVLSSEAVIRHRTLMRAACSSRWPAGSAGRSRICRRSASRTRGSDELFAHGVRDGSARPSTRSVPFGTRASSDIGATAPAAVVACFALLAEAMVGVAVTGERKWHASWWEWHGLIVAAYLVVVLAVRREWGDERFRRLYLPTTRARYQDVSVLFADLVGFTGFAERSSSSRAAAVLDAYWGMAAPLITRDSAATWRSSSATG